MVKKIQTKIARIPFPIFNEIKRFQKSMQREENNRFGKRKRLVSFELAFREWHKQMKLRNSNANCFGGGFL